MGDPASARLLNDGARDLLSGMVAGFVVKIVEYPLDTVKVLQQTMGGRYKGTWDCVKHTYRGGGAVAFYRGLPSPLLGSMAECSTLFLAYGYVKKLLDVDEARATLANPVPIWKYAVAGGVSGCFSSVVLTPVELVKCRLQVQSGAGALAAAGASGSAELAKPYSGALDCVARILRQEGIAGLWRGQLGTLAREVPGNLAWFGAYETTLRAVQLARGYDRKADVPLVWNALSGAVAGVAYWLVPFPADTVKSKLQTDPAWAGRPFMEVFRAVLREEGVAGLYRGAGITCARAAPAHALLFVTYEVADAYLRKL